MSAVDDITQEIAEFCKQENVNKFSREIVYEYVDNGVIDKLVDEIVGKLKVKGITVI